MSDPHSDPHSATHETAPPRRSALYDRHEALGASFTDFGGWSMPVRYGSDLAEHRAVREAAGLFDISHMAEFVVTGVNAGAFLDWALAGRMSTLPVGKAKYSFVLADDGGIIDDVIAYRLGEHHYLVVANAGNRDDVAAALDSAGASFVSPPAEAGEDHGWAQVAGSGVRVEDASDETALIAVQGPRAREVLEALEGFEFSAPASRAGDPPSPWSLDGLPYYAARTALFDGVQVLVARTGYTGEDGYELFIAPASAGSLWDALRASGGPFGLQPSGLAARDTLRLEAGMPLYGHELTRDIVPAQAGLARAVAVDKTDFVGKAGVAAASADRPVLVALTSAGKRAGRAGYGVYDGDEPVGEITSGALSPTLGHPIALAFVAPASSSPGTELTIDVRGTRIPATVTAPPLYRRKK